MISDSQENQSPAKTMKKAGISLQTSTPIYSQRHYGPFPTRHDKDGITENQRQADSTSDISIHNASSVNPTNTSNVSSTFNGLTYSNQENTHEHHHIADHSHHHDHVHQHEHNHSNHHHHDNHIHDHPGHSHHDNAHEHNHSFPPVHTPSLPSWFQIFTRLAPIQKTIFTWFLFHYGIGIGLYCIGNSLESLSLIGFSYLMIFDALGVLNSFVSSVLRTNSAFGMSNTKRPFGAHRYEVVFALGTTIYLLFATMHNTKESLEHFLLESHHSGEQHENDEHHSKLTLGMFFMIGFAITATCLSSIALRNHDNFVRYLRRRPTTVHGFTYNVINRARGNPVHALLSNIYSSSIVLCGSVILLSYMFGIATPFFDKMLALFESVVMFYLGYPTAKALAKILLQTTPITVQNGVENRLREIQQDPNVIQVSRVHFWQTTYGKYVGTIEIQIRPEADDQAILQFVYQKLQGLTSNDLDSGNNGSELTVSIVK
ncbi:MAG: cation efflux family-domain-containing protein [Benjaminiella poitrasii]|nr:MAG: cation efflux family-domain-containing protein [Benjaminiella poitrasii]